MAHLAGHPSQSPALVGIPAPRPDGIPIGGPSAPPRQVQPQAIVVDGTPVRVVLYALSAAAGLWALRLAGIKFNVGVS